jgi:hypothetical protein
MKWPKPEAFPIDEANSFVPDKILFLERSSGISNEAEVRDITSEATASGNLSDEFLEQAKSSATSFEPQFVIKKKPWSPGTVVVLDAEEKLVATLSMSILSFGVRTFTFPEDSQHSGHKIEMRPCGIGRKEEMFVKDSVLYFWEAESSKRRTLYKVLGGKKTVIAKYAAKHGYLKQGILTLDSAELDELVGLLSCFALLNQVDSFTK